MFNRTKIKQHRMTRYIDKDRIFDDFTKVYLFSNEQLKKYNEIYDFDNARVMSVLGSGDQYFTSMLNGAKEVEVFDINKAAWNYFRIKFYAIQILSYEEFLNFFYNYRLYFHKQISSKEDRLREQEIYYKLMHYLPSDLHDTLFRYRLDSLDTICPIFILIKAPSKIDYFSRENYSKLQQILLGSRLPNFYNINILDLWKVAKGRYDLMLFSNVADYLEMSLEEYKTYLETFKCSQIQANYAWLLNNYSKDTIYKHYENLGFQTNILGNECVISLKRSKK